MKQTRTRGLPHYQGSGRLHGLLLILTLIEVTAITSQAIFLARAVTFLFQHVPLSAVWRDIGLFALAFAVRYIAVQAQKALSERYAEQTAKHLRRRLMTAYFTRHLFMAQKKGTGHLVTLMIDGIDQVKQYLEIISTRLLHAVVIPIVLVVYVWGLDHTAAIILVATVPIIIMFMILLGKVAKSRADKQYETYQRLSNHFIDSLKGLETLAFLGKSRSHAAKINRVNTDYRKMTMQTLRVAFLSSFALDFFTSLSIAFVAVSLGLRLIDGHMDLLPALTILILIPEYYAPIKQVGKDYHATLDGQVAIAEVENVLQAESERDKEGIAIETKAKNQVLRQTNRIEVNGQDVPLSFADVSVVLDGETVLSHLSFSISPGWTGVIGPSGSGKTSLIHVLVGRIYPTKGTIKLADQSYASLNQPAWYEQIAYIPQSPYIFPLTLAENCCFYAPEATDESIWQVIDSIGLADFVRKLPNGIHEPIGEGGRMLSGGQAQRIAMARALLSDKPVILLDEPTAHLDIETEYEIKQVMRRVFRDKRVIFATHRLHWMNEMDEIVLLNNGTIADHGSRAELQQAGRAYQAFVREQRREHG